MAIYILVAPIRFVVDVNKLYFPEKKFSISFKMANSQSQHELDLTGLAFALYRQQQQQKQLQQLLQQQDGECTQETYGTFFDAYMDICVHKKRVILN